MSASGRRLQNGAASHHKRIKNPHDSSIREKHSLWIFFIVIEHLAFRSSIHMSMSFGTVATICMKIYVLLTLIV